MKLSRRFACVVPISSNVLRTLPIPIPKLRQNRLKKIFSRKNRLNIF